MKCRPESGQLKIRPAAEQDIRRLLEVYRSSEDFLSLGPQKKATLEMVLADLHHSKESGGVYCGIWNRTNNLVGVIDYVPEWRPRVAFLSLIMISAPLRSKGIGAIVLAEMESYLKEKFGTQKIESAVQTNNKRAIHFWKNHGFHIETKPLKQQDGTVTYRMNKDLSH